MVLETVLSV